MNTPFSITHYKLIPITIPLTHPLKQRNGIVKKLPMLVLHLITNNGIKGESFIYGIGEFGNRALISYLQDQLMPSILHRQFNSPTDIWNSVWVSNREKISGGLMLYGLALMDIACWDIAAKANGQSVHSFLGGNSTHANVYGSGGWLTMSDEELVNECYQFMQQGISLYKIKIGGDRDEARIKFLRDVLGTKIQLAADGNQSFEFTQAKEKAAMLLDYGVAWFEDPLFSDSLCTLQKLTNSVGIPICVGENYSLKWKFEDVCMMNAANILQPDIIRCGGITPFIDIKNICDQYTKKIITHLMPELSISLLTLAETAYSCEFIQMLPTDLFTLRFDITDGKMQIPTESGIGVYIDPDKLKKFSL